MAVVTALAALRDPSAIPPHVGVIDDLGATAIHAFVRIGDVRAVPALADLWREPGKRVDATDALLEFAKIDPNAVPLDILQTLPNTGDVTEIVSEEQFRFDPWTGEMLPGPAETVTWERVVVSHAKIRDAAKAAIARRR